MRGKVGPPPPSMGGRCTRGQSCQFKHVAGWGLSRGPAGDFDARGPRASGVPVARFCAERAGGGGQGARGCHYMVACMPIPFIRRAGHRSALFAATLMKEIQKQGRRVFNSRVEVRAVDHLPRHLINNQARTVLDLNSPPHLRRSPSAFCSAAPPAAAAAAVAAAAAAAASMTAAAYQAVAAAAAYAAACPEAAAGAACLAAAAYQAAASLAAASLAAAAAYAAASLAAAAWEAAAAAAAYSGLRHHASRRACGRCPAWPSRPSTRSRRCARPR